MKCILWTTAIRDLFDPHVSRIGGVNVQMFFWAKTFLEKSWNVYSFADKDNIESIEGINFLTETRSTSSNFILYPFFVYKIIKSIKPDLIITRAGNNRNLLWIALFSRIFKIKHVHFIASDKELCYPYISFRQFLNFRLFLLGIKLLNNVVVQNTEQEKQVKNNFSKIKLLLIPNIWRDTETEKSVISNQNYVLWVANFRQLKRPDRFIKLARRFSNIQFYMIGAPSEPGVYEKYKEESASIPNLHFEGKKDFFIANSYFRNAKCFVCTSEFEGVPNTFLQAWNCKIPVISTVDPSNIIANNQLGIVCSNENELFEAIERLYTDDSLYGKISDNIQNYFIKNHSSEIGYRRLIDFLQ